MGKPLMHFLFPPQSLGQILGKFLPLGNSLEISNGNFLNFIKVARMIRVHTDEFCPEFQVI